MSETQAQDTASFVTFLNEVHPLIEDCLVARAPQPTSLGAEAPDVQRYLYEPVLRFTTSAGKRVRPALCLLGAQAVGAAREKALAAAAAVEYFQAAALIHDDIADNGELRRGEPCLHIAEGVGLAINAGDGALVNATATILRDENIEPLIRLNLLEELIKLEEHTLEGQALDLGWVRDKRWDLSTNDYLTMATSKTAYYSAAMPLAMGARCGGGTAEQVEGLRAFGMQCGLAFQIQDDLLNLVGDTASSDKDYRTDITEGKRTLVMVWALEHLDAPERAELVELLSSQTSDPEKLSRAVEITREVGALDYAKDYARTLTEQAKQGLDQLVIADEARIVLRSMADFFIARSH
ncbi:MAG: polyprenyl synthetase family protein [Coriobacteriales bacterium]|nr:polyprenyl synthetase family protein [Coriobacteriales bacterium]